MNRISHLKVRKNTLDIMKMMERVPPAVVQFFCNSHPVVYVVVYGERSGEYIASRSPVNSRTRQLAECGA